MNGFYKFREQLFSLRWWRSWATVVAGALVMAAGFVLFINPYYIVPGGVYGTGVVLHYLFPDIAVGTFGLMLDVPLLLIGLRVFGGREQERVKPSTLSFARAHRINSLNAP